MRGATGIKTPMGFTDATKKHHLPVIFSIIRRIAKQEDAGGTTNHVMIKSQHARTLITKRNAKQRVASGIEIQTVYIDATQLFHVTIGQTKWSVKLIIVTGGQMEHVMQHPSQPRLLP